MSAEKNNKLKILNNKAAETLFPSRFFYDIIKTLNILMKKTLICLFTLALVMLSSPILIHAQDGVKKDSGSDIKKDSGSDKSAGSVTIDNPLGANATPEEIIGRIISGALGVVGSLALLMFIYGGFTWMLAGGNTEAVTKGRNILMWAAIGLVVIFTSYTLVKFVITSLGPEVGPQAQAQ